MSHSTVVQSVAVAVQIIFFLLLPTYLAEPSTVTDQGWYPTPIQGQGYGPNVSTDFYFNVVMDRLASIKEADYTFTALMTFDFNWLDETAAESIEIRTTESQLGTGPDCNRYCSSYRWQGALPYLCCDSIFLPTFVLRNLKEFPQTSLYWSVALCNDNTSVSYSVEVEATYFTGLDFKKFPFDSQKLLIILEFIDVTRDDKPYVIQPSAQGLLTDDVTQYVNGWELSTMSVTVVNTLNKNRVKYFHQGLPQDTCAATRSYSGLDSTFYGLEVVVEVDRISWVLLLNVVLPLFLIGLLAFTTFMFRADDIGTRLGILSTLVVALMAAQWVVGSSIPDSSYMVPPQAQVLLNYILFMALIIENCIVAYIVSLQDKRMTWRRLKQRKFVGPRKWFYRTIGRTFTAPGRMLKRSSNRQINHSGRRVETAAAAIAAITAEMLESHTLACLEYCVSTIERSQKIALAVNDESCASSVVLKVLQQVVQEQGIALEQKMMLLQMLLQKELISEDDVKQTIKSAWDYEINATRSMLDATGIHEEPNHHSCHKTANPGSHFEEGGKEGSMDGGKDGTTQCPLASEIKAPPRAVLSPATEHPPSSNCNSVAAASSANKCNAATGGFSPRSIGLPRQASAANPEPALDLPYHDLSERFETRISMGDPPVQEGSQSQSPVRVSFGKGVKFSGDEAATTKRESASGWSSWVPTWRKSRKSKRDKVWRKAWHDSDYCMWLAKLVDSYSCAIFLMMYFVSTVIIFTAPL